MGGAVFLYLYDWNTTTPSGEAAATLRGLSLLMGHQGLTDLLIKLHPSLGGWMGATRQSCLDIIQGLGHHNTTIEYPEDKSSLPPPLDPWGRTRPFHRIATSTRPHPSLQRDCNHHLLDSYHHPDLQGDSLYSDFVSWGQCFCIIASIVLFLLNCIINLILILIISYSPTIELWLEISHKVFVWS